MTEKPLVWIVDDDGNIRDSLKELFLYALSNYFIDEKNVLTKASGLIAKTDLEKPLLIKPTIILSDFIMPGLNGGELLLYAKKLFPYIKTILCSSYNPTDRIVSQYKSAIDYYLIKPAPADKICSVIETILKNQN